jgi:Fe-S-cluster containining protein
VDLTGGRSANLSPGLVRALDQFRAVVDAQSDALEASDARFVCPIPCSGCCTPNLFFITGLDFLGVCHHVHRSLSEEVRADIVLRARALVAECGLEEALRLDGAGGDGEPNIVQRCPLLDASERCLAYVARPTPCRFFGRSRFQAGEANLCTIIAGRLGSELAHTALPVVEQYSRALADALARNLTAEEMEAVEPFIAVSTLPILISETAFDPTLILEVCGRTDFA